MTGEAYKTSTATPFRLFNACDKASIVYISALMLYSAPAFAHS